MNILVTGGSKGIGKNIAGGMKMTEPAIDLGICLAIASSMKDIVIPDKLMAFGEIGLSGEVLSLIHI